LSSSGILQVKEQLAAALAESVTHAGLEVAQLPAIQLSPTPDKRFGDLSANLAMLIAKEAGRKPREVAELLAKHLEVSPDVVERVEVAGAGFINFFLHPGWALPVVREILQVGDGYGRSNEGQGRRVQIEFVSANPTGPLGVHHGRGGAIGDALANLLAWTGHQVEREFYINNERTSLQMRRFGESVEARYLQLCGREVKVPEDGYQGEYVGEIAQAIRDRDGDRYLEMPSEQRVPLFTKLAEQEMLREQREVLERFGIRYDRWFEADSLFESGEVDEVVKLLTEGGFTYEAEDALWLRTTGFGDDRDRTLVRRTGQPTYLATDAAYHRDKFGRGFDLVIDIWGPDHHGYMARTRAAVQALGFAPERLELIIYQLVRLLRHGDLVPMSKRAGDIVLLSDLIDEVGTDVARFFYLMRSSDSHLDFDLELAKQQSRDNPVYYVQYAHVRTCSIFARASERGIAIPEPDEADLSLLRHERELDLMRKLAELPEEIAIAAAMREPHRLTAYAQGLAQTLHGFYDSDDCRVLDDQNAGLTAARLCLVRAAQVVLRNALTILGLSAPEQM